MSLTESTVILHSEVRDVVAELQRLLGGAWSRSLAQALFERIDALGEAAQENGEAELAESVLGLSAYLASFADSSIPPQGEHAVQLRGLAESLIEAVPAQTRAPHSVASAQQLPTADLYAWGPEFARFQLVPWFAQQRLKLVVLDSDQQLWQLLAERPSQIVLLGQSMLGEKGMDPAEHRAVLERATTLVVAESDLLSQRVAAARVGAEGYFVLPADARPLALRIAQVRADRESPVRVLVIDDDASMSKYLESILSHNGMQVRALNRAADALRAIEDDVPDVILADLHMPEFSGIDLLAVFRAHAKTAQTPVLLVTGDEEVERRIDALSRGADDYLVKPVKPRHLVAAVANRARRSRRLNPRSPG